MGIWDLMGQNEATAASVLGKRCLGPCHITELKLCHICPRLNSIQPGPAKTLIFFLTSHFFLNYVQYCQRKGS
jgi:hypothetical protein